MFLSPERGISKVELALCIIGVRRWVFPRTALDVVRPINVAALLRKAGSSLLASIFPDNCRVCESPLQGVSRVPVCPSCLAAPQPFAAEIFCRRCRAAFHTPWPLDEDGLCLSCRAGLNRFDAVYCYGAYDGPLPRLIHLFKYDRIESLAQPLGAFLARGLPRDAAFDALVPVPIHWWKRCRRGFNQSEELARVLSRRTGLPVERLLRRRGLQSQAGLNGRERRLNVRRAFVAAAPRRAAGKRLLLIDDVFTTGATANACAGILKQAGAAHVSVLALARADRRMLVSGREGREG